MEGMHFMLKNVKDINPHLNLLLNPRHFQFKYRNL